MYELTSHVVCGGGFAAQDRSERLSVVPCPASRVAAWDLPHCPEAASAARRLARLVLRGWDVDLEAAEAVLLTVSELVTNAVEHARPPLTLHLACPDGSAAVRVEVSDGGPSATSGDWVASCEPDEHGRGGQIVDFLAADRGTRTGDEHATNWADLALSVETLTGTV